MAWDLGFGLNFPANGHGIMIKALKLRRNKDYGPLK